jgi:hypothetical protein
MQRATFPETSGKLPETCRCAWSRR